MAQHITTFQSEYKFQFDISGSNFVFYKCRKIRFSNVDITVEFKGKATFSNRVPKAFTQGGNNIGKLCLKYLH